MSKKHEIVTEDVDTNIATPTPEFITEGVACYLVKTDTGVAIKDIDGNIGPDCEISKDGLAYKLTPNAANRTWFMLSKFEKEIALHPDGIPLTYRATKVLGPQSDKLPNEKLVKAFLTPDELAEYTAIIDRAKARKADAKAKPATEEEKLRASIERGQKKLAELLAKQSEGGNE